MTYALRAAAWVPAVPGRDVGEATRLAVVWTERQCWREHARAIVVTSTRDQFEVPELAEFSKQHSHVTRRSQQRLAGEVPVLVYLPDADDLDFAVHLAGSSSLAVVESGAFALRGWAAWLEALDLVSGEPTPGLVEVTKGALERLVFYGNNAFDDDFGKERARAVLAELRGRGKLDRDLLLGAALAAGLSAHAVKNLGRLMG